MKFLINVWRSDRVRINRDSVTDHFKMNIVLKLNRIILLKSEKDFIKKKSSLLDRVWTALLWVNCMTIYPVMSNIGLMLMPKR